MRCGRWCGGPGYALLVVSTLGLAIGSSAAVYGALDRVVLRPLPYPDGDLLLGVAALACWVPARRAARVDPAVTLRGE